MTFGFYDTYWNGWKDNWFVLTLLLIFIGAIIILIIKEKVENRKNREKFINANKLKKKGKMKHGRKEHK